MDLLRLVVLAAVGEAIWESLKMTWQSGKLSIDRIGALIFGLLLALGTGMDLMQLIGIPMVVPYLGMVLTGILVSRGANFIHSFLASIDSIKTNSQINTAAIQLLTTTTLNQVKDTYGTPTMGKPITNPYGNGLPNTATNDDNFPESKSTITLDTDTKDK